MSLQAGWIRQRRWWPSVMGITLLFSLGAATLATAQVPRMRADVHVRVNYTSPVGYSQFSPGLTYVDNSLVYPWKSNDLTAVNKAKSLIGSAVSYENTAIMGWGLPDPWPDPSTPGPTNWSALDARIKLINSTGGVPVITLSEAPWWMKGQLQADGTTRVLTQADEWQPIAYSSRILDDEMGAWLLLVQRVAERYMAAPYNVRYFQVWNELKGYYDPITNAYDYTTSPGDPSGPNAKHGYTYMYNRVYQRLMSAAATRGIPSSDVQVGGPYVVVDTWSNTKQSNPSRITKSYGTFDQRPFDVVKYWLQHKAGAAFITVDAYGSNKDGVNVATATTSAEKFADIVRWIRSLDAKTYPGAATLPIWLGEWYAQPFEDTNGNNHSNAIKTYAMMEFLKAGGSVALAWGSPATDTTSPRLWTNTTQGGGAPLPFYYSYLNFKEYFSSGAPLYDPVITPPGRVDAVASDRAVMLVNLTSSATIVAVNGQMVTLDPYQVTIVPKWRSLPSWM